MKRALDLLAVVPEAISCRLSPDELVERQRAWRAVSEHLDVVERDRFVGGFRIVVRGSDADLEQVSRLVAAERDCCGWASWELEQNAELATLTASGEEELIAPLASRLLRS